MESRVLRRVGSFGRPRSFDGRTGTFAVEHRMRPPISDDRLFELALEAFRHPPQSYYEWVDEVLARRRVQAPRAPAEPVASDPSRMATAGSLSSAIVNADRERHLRARQS
jgi:hypothetical protein